MPPGTRQVDQFIIPLSRTPAGQDLLTELRSEQACFSVLLIPSFFGKLGPSGHKSRGSEGNAPY